MGQLLPGARRQPTPTAVATRIDRRYRRTIVLRAIEMNLELLPSYENVAILGRYVGPGLQVVRIVMIGRHGFLGRNLERRSYDDEESNAQQNPTMIDAACLHVLTFC